MKTGDVSKFVE